MIQQMKNSRQRLEMQVSIVQFDISRMKTIAQLEQALFAGQLPTAEDNLHSEAVSLPNFAWHGQLNTVWLVDGAFYQQYASGIENPIFCVDAAENWLWSVITQAQQMLQADECEQCFVAALQGINYIVLSFTTHAADSQYSVKISALPGDLKNWQVEQSLCRSGRIEVLSGWNVFTCKKLLQQPALVESAWRVLSVGPYVSITPYSEMLQCLRAVLSLENCMLYPGTASDDDDLPAGFITLKQAVPWFVSATQKEREASLVSFSPSGRAAILKLTAVSDTVQPAVLHCETDSGLWVIQGDSGEVLLEELGQFSQVVESSHELPPMRLFIQPGKQYRLVLVADTPEHLKAEIDSARSAVRNAIETGKEWNSLAGSYFSPTPLGSDAKVAFVYPGAFNSYPDMGGDLLRHFPILHQWLEKHTNDALDTYQAPLIFTSALGHSEEKAQEALLRQPLSMLFSGTAIAGLYTSLLTDGFGIQPDAALGYSMGETSMFFASGFWQNSAAMKSEISQLPLFHRRLSGRTEAVREYWQAMGCTVPEGAEPIWDNILLMTTAEKAIVAIADEPQVYLTHINTPRQVIIGGEPQACKRAAARIKCMSFPLPYHYPMHCAAIASEYAILTDLHTQPVENQTSITFYNSFGKEPFQISSSAIAETIAGGLVNRVDFPALIERVYADGARIFIEVGARSNCSKWIENILRDQECCVVAMNQEEISDYQTLLKALARLISHGIPLTLDWLQAPTQKVETAFLPASTLESRKRV